MGKENTTSRETSKSTSVQYVLQTASVPHQSPPIRPSAGMERNAKKFVRKSVMEEPVMIKENVAMKCVWVDAVERPIMTAMFAEMSSSKENA